MVTRKEGEEKAAARGTALSHECWKGPAALDCKNYLSVRGRSEYKTWNKKVKELMDESKMRVDEEFDRKLSEIFIYSRELTQKTIQEGVEERQRRYRGCGSEDEEGFWK